MTTSYNRSKQSTRGHMRRCPAPTPNRSAAAALALLLALATGCATTAEKQFSTEKLLVAAGFHYKVAQRPEEMEKLRKLPQGKLIRHEYHGKPVYLYVSADGCRCHYAGTEAAYLKYRELARDAALNAGMHNSGDIHGESLLGPDESMAAYMDDLANGMIPGY